MKTASSTARRTSSNFVPNKSNLQCSTAGYHITFAEHTEEHGNQANHVPIYPSHHSGMSVTLTSTETISLSSLSLACIGVLANTLQGEGEPLIASIAFSGLAFAFCYALIRWLGNAFIKRGFKGRDLCKLKQTEM